jgi:hypothetical protein
MSGQSDSFFDEASAFLIGLGIVTFALFPLA